MEQNHVLVRIRVMDLRGRIHLIRGKQVMLDADLAEIYGVPTMRLNEQVRRNLNRFPSDFMFQLNPLEAQGMRSRIAIASRRNIRHLPRVFTEQGVAMLSSVLHSERAVAANIEIMRTIERTLKAHGTRLDLHGEKILEVSRELKRLAEP